MGANIEVFPAGFLNIDKPKGWTSFDVVARLRKITGVRQIGHTGTLDPFATGVLPVCIGKTTRLIEYLSDDKQYVATVQFGKNTDTYDIDGNITEIFDKKVRKEEILDCLKNFEGEILQLPPIYSAIKKDGKKLYEYARAGESVEITPRKVFIKKVSLVEFDEEYQVAKIEVECSAGTYIRSIAYDLGKSLCCGGYLSELRRTKTGRFCIEDSIELDRIKTIEDAKSAIVKPVEALDKPIMELSETEAGRISHGMYIKNKSYKNSDIVILVYNGKIHGVGLVDNNKILAKKVFEVL